LNLISIPINVAPNATPGMRSLIVEQGNDVAYANGFLVVLEEQPDQNLDGLEDHFQRRYFPLWTASAAGPGADPDQDGFNNAAEYLADTDPVNPNSFFKIERIFRTASGVALEWHSAAGRTYQILGRSDPVVPWQPLGPSILATASTTRWADNVVNGVRRFYRLQVVK
jgi:hypothetical protein